MDNTGGSDSSAENANKAENAKKVDNADDSSTKKTEGSEGAGAKSKYIGMTAGRSRSMERSKRRRRSTIRRSRGRSRAQSFSASMFKNHDGNNPVGKELTALVMLSLLTILAFVSLIDLDPDYIITWLEWLQTDTVRGIFVLLAALMLAIPFFLPITKIVYVTLGFFYGFLAGWTLSMVGVTLGFLLTFFIGRFLCTCIHDYINYRAETLVGRRKWIIIQKLLLRDGIYCKFSLKSIDKLNILRVLTKEFCSLPSFVQVHSLCASCLCHPTWYVIS